MKYKPKTKPFKHQAKATLKVARRKNYALYMEPRTGKTKAVLDAVGMLALAGHVERVAVFGPKIAADVWADELRKHFPYPYTWEDPEFARVSRNRKAEGPTVHFQFWNYEKIAHRKRSKRGSYHYPYVKEAEAFDPDLCVEDESHRMKRPGGVTAQAMWRMVRRLRGESEKPWVVLLSGTANPKGWRDIFAQFRVMDDTIFGTTVQLFDEEYCVYGTGPRQYVVVKYQNLKKLLKKVRAHSFTVTQEEAGLANKQFWQYLRVDLPPSARKIYDTIAEEYLATLKGGETIDAPNAGVARLRLLQVTGGFSPEGALLHREKLNTLRSYLDDLHDQGQHVLVYAHFLREVRECTDVAERAGYKTFTITGKTKGRDRRLAFQVLRRGAKPTCLVLQTQVGSLAIDLSAAAEVVYYSTPDGWEAYWQSLNRVCGPGQKRAVRYTHLVARGTVDIGVLAGLRKKEDMHRKLMRDPRRFLLPP